MIRLSVIVPFYNVEKYIEQCIRSLYDQDIPYEEYEVICVDDCSPDGSRVIVERLQEEYSTLQLICHTENKRQGGARNTGLRASKGQYVWFVDSDDYVLPNVLNTIVQAADRDNLEILQFNEDNSSSNSIGVMSGIEYATSNSDVWSGRLPLMWRTMFLRSFLLKNNLFFVEHVQFEDTDFALRAFLVAMRVRYINCPVYVYCVHPESTVHRANSPKKIFEQVLLLDRTSEILEQSVEVHYGELLQRYIRNELSILGLQIQQLSIKDRFQYTQMACVKPLGKLCKYTSKKNALRVRFGICIS